jgi:hypothetical protein
MHRYSRTERAKCRSMTLDEVAKIAKELLGARCEALITEEFGAPAKFMALLVLKCQ